MPKLCEESREAYWKELLKEWEASGLGLEKWCRTNAHPYYQARYWKRKLYRWKVEKAFVEAKEPELITGHVRICVGGVEIEVSAGFDAEVLRQVVQALRGCVC